VACASVSRPQRAGFATRAIRRWLDLGMKPRSATCREGWRGDCCRHVAFGTRTLLRGMRGKVKACGNSRFFVPRCRALLQPLLAQRLKARHEARHDYRTMPRCCLHRDDWSPSGRRGVGARDREAVPRSILDDYQLPSSPRDRHIQHTTFLVVAK
jgi:hypothetical protein